ncbi:hypothetical protein CISG_06817 [Coccidioides immitis RMSCC 3703]|uniref:Uncharacterized protein n=2 Tax=Coccidioides immitis TaxID=5501 RepID=A0A0J8R156_COCIT|nr:hypothetical protein CIRG_06892 [Coccidioides immitis RMSCC 2394]KMU78055.1 hypothetical protein CISG_06817 [Coccidioides immitis RMSCC 3703]
MPREEDFRRKAFWKVSLVQAALPREETPIQRNHPSTSVSFVIPGAAQLKRRQSSRAPGTSAFVTSGSGFSAFRTVQILVKLFPSLTFRAESQLIQSETARKKKGLTAESGNLAVNNHRHELASHGAQESRHGACTQWFPVLQRNKDIQPSGVEQIQPAGGVFAFLNIEPQWNLPSVH